MLLAIDNLTMFHLRKPNPDWEEADKRYWSMCKLTRHRSLAQNTCFSHVCLFTVDVVEERFDELVSLNPENVMRYNWRNQRYDKAFKVKKQQLCFIPPTVVFTATPDIHRTCTECIMHFAHSCFAFLLDFEAFLSK